MRLQRELASPMLVPAMRLTDQGPGWREDGGPRRVGKGGGRAGDAPAQLVPVQFVSGGVSKRQRELSTRALGGGCSIGDLPQLCLLKVALRQCLYLCFVHSSYACRGWGWGCGRGRGPLPTPCLSALDSVPFLHITGGNWPPPPLSPPWPSYPTCSSSPPAALPPLPFAGRNVGGLKVLECSAKVPSTLEMARGSGGSRCGGIPEGRGHGGGLLGGGSARARARLWVPSPFGSPMLNLPPNIPFPLSQLTLPRAELLWVPSGRGAEL